MADQGQKLVKIHHNYLSRELIHYIKGGAVTSVKKIQTGNSFCIEDKVELPGCLLLHQKYQAGIFRVARRGIFFLILMCFFGLNPIEFAPQK